MKDIVYKEMYQNELSHAWYEQTRNLALDYLVKFLKKDAKILDAGSGTGGTLHYLKRAGFKNTKGIDSNEIALTFSRKRGIKNVKIGDVNNLGFKNNSFDAIICLDVLYHKGVNPELAAREFFRVLKKGGVAYVQEPAYDWLKSKHDLAIETERRFTKDKITKMLLEAGFKIEKATYFNLFFFVPIAAKRLKEKFFKDNQTSSDVEKLSPLLNKSLNIALHLERQIVKKINLPAGLSIVTIATK